MFRAERRGLDSQSPRDCDSVIAPAISAKERKFVAVRESDVDCARDEGSYAVCNAATGVVSPTGSSTFLPKPKTAMICKLELLLY